MSTIEQIKYALKAHIEEAEAATSGPWHTHEMESIHVGNGQPDSLWELVYSSERIEELLESSQKQLRNNASFIAHARTISPLVCLGSLQMIEWLEEDAKVSASARSRLESIRQEWHNLTQKQ